MPVLDGSFEAFVTNLGKYNEGELVGEWVHFPTTEEEMKEVFERIGIGSKGEFGQVYEEWFITDYDCSIHGVSNLLGEYENLDKLNYLAARLDEMSRSELEHFVAIMDSGCDEVNDLDDLINLTYNLDNYDFIPDIKDYDDLGRYYFFEGGYNIDNKFGSFVDYIDFERYGEDCAINEGGTLTDAGYIRPTGDSWNRYFDGTLEDIPDEYRVTGSGEELEPPSTITVLAVSYTHLDYSFGYIAGWSSDKETKELKGSLETIRKTAAEMITGIDEKLKERLAVKEQEAPTPLRDAAIPVYREAAMYAFEAGELDAYRTSMQANMDCKEAIEQTINDYYGNNRLAAESAVKSILEKFSPERVAYVLAQTIQQKDHDGRISRDCKEWAKGMDASPDHATQLIIDSVNPGVVSLFTEEFVRQTAIGKAQEQTPAEQSKTAVPEEGPETPAPKEPEQAAPVKHRLTPVSYTHLFYSPDLPRTFPARQNLESAPHKVLL